MADKASELAKALKEECNEACREKPSHVAQASHAEVLAPKDEVPLRTGRVQKVLLRPEACGRFLRGVGVRAGPGLDRGGQVHQS